jgi:outer membrane receptor protein involved in Fe transport
VLVPNSAEYYSIAPYGVLDGKLSWNFNLPNSKKTMRFSVWGKNILDKQYPLHVIGQGAAPFIPLPGQPVTGYTYQAVAWAPKSMFGAQFEYGF